MRRKKYLLYWTIAALVVCTLWGCRQKTATPVEIHRFDKVLFTTPPASLTEKLASVRNEYNTELLNIQPDNPEYMQMLTGFVEDETMRDVYRIVDSTFGDMQKEAEQLGAALKRANEMCPTLRYDKIYTFVSGMFDYNMRVGCNSHELVISLDQYVLPYTKKYNYFNSPLLSADRLHDSHSASAYSHTAGPRNEPAGLYGVGRKGHIFCTADTGQGGRQFADAVHGCTDGLDAEERGACVVVFPAEQTAV